MISYPIWRKEMSLTSQHLPVKSPPTPRGYPLVGNILDFRKDAFSAYERNWKSHGDSVRFKALPGLEWFFFVHPEAVHHIMVTNAQNYVKGFPFNKLLKLVTGE